MPRRRRPGHSEPQWTREKMLALLLGAVVLGLVVLVGVALSVYYALHPGRHTHAATTTGSPYQAATSGHQQATPEPDPREALAARPMMSVAEEASHPSPVSERSPGAPITLPAATRMGPAGVPTGYPHTVAGAMAQLAAIDQVALQSASLGTARDVIAAWAVPGGPDGSSWSGVRALSALLSSAHTAGSGQLAVVFTPLMGLVKGSVGPDFVIPCIDFELDVTLAQTARGAAADCQRMVWRPADGGRWMIGAGAEPAVPPSVWPDTDLATAVGYRDLRREG